MQEDQEEIKKSKSQVKREMQALRDLGKQLVEQPVAVLDKLAISNSLRDAILHAHGLKREALRRQVQHIGKLLRQEDETDIRARLERISQPQRDQVRAFHQLEQWRDRLLDGDDAPVTTLGQEKAINTFFRLTSPGVIARLRESFPDLSEEPSPRDAFLKLRELRNRW